jgi:hypothetical protein
MLQVVRVADITADLFFAGRIPVIMAKGEAPWAFVFENQGTDHFPNQATPSMINKEQQTALLETISFHGGKIRGLALLGPVMTKEELQRAPVDEQKLKRNVAYRAVWETLQFDETEYVQCNLRTNMCLLKSSFLEMLPNAERSQLMTLIDRYGGLMHKIHANVLRRAHSSQIRLSAEPFIPDSPITVPETKRRKITSNVHAWKFCDGKLMMFSDVSDFWPHFVTGIEGPLITEAQENPGKVIFADESHIDAILKSRKKKEVQWFSEITSNVCKPFDNLDAVVKSYAVFALASLIEWPRSPEFLNLLTSNEQLWLHNFVGVIVCTKGQRDWIIVKCPKVADTGKFLIGYGLRTCAVLDGWVADFYWPYLLPYISMPKPDCIYQIVEKNKVTLKTEFTS